MSQENVEIVRKVYDGWSRSDPSRAFDYLDPDVVWEAIENAPDAGTYRGHSGVKRLMDDYRISKTLRSSSDSRSKWTGDSSWSSGGETEARAAA